MGLQGQLLYEMTVGSASSTATAPLLVEPRTHWTARWCGGSRRTTVGLQGSLLYVTQVAVMSPFFAQGFIFV